MLQTDETYHTAKEVRSILGLSNRSLERRRWDGTLKAYALNSRCYLYAKSALDEFIAKLKAGELETVTYDKAGVPRAQQSRKQRRSRKPKPLPPPKSSLTS